MQKYSASLDCILAAVKKYQEGKVKTAATLFSQAIAHRDFEPTIAMLEARQNAAYAALTQEARVEKKAEEVASRSQSLASFLAEAAAKKKAKKPVAKKAMKAKKKVKADLDDVDFDETLDDMTISEVGDEDLTLDDLDIDMDGDVEEMPIASDDDMIDIDGEGLTDEVEVDASEDEAEDDEEPESESEEDARDDDEDETDSDDKGERDADADKSEEEEDANIDNFKGKQAKPFGSKSESRLRERAALAAKARNPGAGKEVSKVKMVMSNIAALDRLARK